MTSDRVLGGACVALAIFFGIIDELRMFYEVLPVIFPLWLHGFFRMDTVPLPQRVLATKHYRLTVGRHH